MECVCWISQEQRLCYLKLQDQRQQQQQEVSEQERLRQLRENAHNQEAKLRRVRALRGQVEQKRLSNSKLGQCDDIWVTGQILLQHDVCVKSYICLKSVATAKRTISSAAYWTSLQTEVCVTVFFASYWLKPENTNLADKK